jgi:hypothetical protein
MEKRERPLNEPEIYISPSRSFCFDPNKFEFILGNSNSTQSIKLSELDDIYQLDRLTYELKEDVKSDSKGMLLMSTVCDLIEFPMLRKRLISLSESENKLLCKKVESIIKDVYYEAARLGGKPIKLSMRAKVGSIFSFSAAINKNGTFHLTTLGEYSALGTGSYMQNGSLLYRRISQETAWEDPSLPIEYQLHNADRDNAEAKRLSLYAGAGTIAWLAKNNRRNI